MTVDRRELRRLAEDSLGLERWLPGQEAALRALSDGRDTLALLPTGGGKSAIYQLAGVIRPGPTVVVSPLIALQQDQLRALADADVGDAAALDGRTAAGARADIVGRFRSGSLEFLLLAPEQLSDPALVEALATGRPSLFVIDEAHCVTEWGHDFRPEYRRLGAVADAVGRPPILALTATAAPAVRDEIVRWLGMRDPAIVAKGFDRPNIDLSVERHADARAKRRALVAWVAEATPPGIVYTATRAGALALAADLSGAGVRAAPYHAGLGRRQRDEAQDAFMRDDVDVIVATIAFGMGIDKPDVRFIAHLDISDSLDAYYQQIGRAGRDGQPSHARLFFRPEDLGLRRFQGAPAIVTEADARAVLRRARRGGGDVAAVAAAAGRSRRKTEAVVARLEELEGATVAPDGTVQLSEGRGDGLAEAVTRAQERQRRLAASRVEMLRGYAETDGCRRRFLLNYFGEEYEPPCDGCDRCRARAAATAAAADTGSSGSSGADAPAAPPDPDLAPVDAPFALNEAVVHERFGRGTVTRLERDRVTVRFDDVGYRTLDLGEVTARGILAALP